MSFNASVISTFIFDAAEYRFKITGPNNGGSGWNNNVFIVDRPTHTFRFDQHVPGFVYGAQYTVEVAFRQNGSASFGNYGNACNLTVNTPTSPQLVASQCNGSVNFNASVISTWMFDAAEYRFKIEGPNNGGSGWNNDVFIVDRPTHTFRFDLHVPGYIGDQTYSIQVAFRQTGSTTWSAYGNTCTLFVNSLTTQLAADQCNASLATNIIIYANPAVGAQGYRFKITGPNNNQGGWVNNTFILDRNVNDFNIQEHVPGTSLDTYTVQVAYLQLNGQYTSYGASCDITLESIPDFAPSDDNPAISMTKEQSLDDFSVAVSSNPFNESFSLSLVNSNHEEAVSITVYDMTGKLVEVVQVGMDELHNVRLGSTYQTGMYMVILQQGTNQVVLKQIKN